MTATITSRRIEAVLAKSRPPRRTVAQVLATARVVAVPVDAEELASRIDAFTVRASDAVQRRAKPGGEFGANGEWYEGGKWIANTNDAKKHKPTYHATRKQNVGPYKWEVLPEGKLALFPMMAGREKYDRASDKFTFDESLSADLATPEAIANRKQKIELYNAGHRMVDVPPLVKIQATDLASRIQALTVRATQSKQMPVTEVQPTKVEYGCLMATAPATLRRKLVKWTQTAVPESAVDEKHGREKESHVTVFYGFHEGFNDFNKLAGLRLNGDPSIEFTLGTITRFECPEYDVLKVDIESPEAIRWNTRIGEEFAEQVTQSKWPYHPHMTLAYLKKGACPELDGSEAFAGKKFSVKSLVYSETEGKGKTTVHLSDKEATPVTAAAQPAPEPSPVPTLRKHDAARARAEAIYLAAMVAAAAKLKGERDKKKRDEAILLLLLLAGEDAYIQTHLSLLGAITHPDTTGTRNVPSGDVTDTVGQPASPELVAEAERFAAGRQPLLRDFADRVADELEEAEDAAEETGASAKDVLKATTEAARKAAGTMVDVETTATVGSVNLERLKRAGFKTAIWDQLDRTTKRHTHAINMEMGPQPIGFVYPNGQAYPGDERGGVGECVNCLCQLVGVDR